MSLLENKQLKPLQDKKAKSLSEALNQDEKKKELENELVALNKELKEAAKESQIYRIAIKIKVFGEFISGGKIEDDIDKYKSTMTCRKTDDKQTIECTSYTDSEAEKADCSKQIPKNQV